MEVTAEALLRRVGEEIGLSPWIRVDQGRIDRFAEVTEDWQFLHVDPPRAAAGPYRGTVAHGFLTLALLPVLAAGALPALRGVRHGINYGLDRVRFLAPVPSGGRVRGRFTLRDGRWRAAGELLLTWSVAVEVEGGEARPALVADWHVLRRVAEEAA